MVGVAAVRGLDGQVDRARVVREILDHAHARDHAEQLLPALDPTKQPHRLTQRLELAPLGARDRQRGGDVGEVVVAGQQGRELAQRGAALEQLEHGPAHARSALDRNGVAQAAGPWILPAPEHPVGCELAARRLGHAHRPGVAGVDDQQALRRDPGDELDEGLPHRLEVREDVRVVELDAGEDRPLRLVVEELGLLVEEGRVVLVALEHDALPPAELRTAAEVLRHPADQP